MEMEIYEMLGYIVDGLYVNRQRVKERDGTDSKLYNRLDNDYLRFRDMFIEEHGKYLAKENIKRGNENGN